MNRGTESVAFYAAIIRSVTFEGAIDSGTLFGTPLGTERRKAGYGTRK